MALLQIRSILVSPRLPHLAILPFHRSTRDILTKFNREPALYNNDESNHIAPLGRQPQASQDIDADKNIPFYLQDQL